MLRLIIRDVSCWLEGITRYYTANFPHTERNIVFLENRLLI